MCLFLRGKLELTVFIVVSGADLEPDQMKGVKVDGKEILLVNLNGVYYAIGNICTHRGCPLSAGTIKGENVECICHGSTFDIKTGRVVRGPAETSEPKYEVQVESGHVLISVE